MVQWVWHFCLASCSVLVAAPALGACGAKDVELAVANAQMSRDRWMRALRNSRCANFAQRRLVDVTIVGSHDSAAWWLSDEAAHCGIRCRACQQVPSKSKRWGVAQSGDIMAQLAAGVRYFDLRLTVDRSGDGCRKKETVTAACWKAWHCLLGRPVTEAVQQLHQFLAEDAQDPSRHSEIVILNFKLEFYESQPTIGKGNPRLTLARVAALLALMEAELGEFIFDAAGDWWLMPVQQIMDSGKRLIILISMGTSHNDLLLKVMPNQTNRFRPFQKCDPRTKDCRGPLWGSYSNTCCHVGQNSEKQRAKQDTYTQRFLPGLSHEEAVESNASRPLLQLYWTLTFTPASNLKNDYGNRVHSLEEAAAEANQWLFAFFNGSFHMPIFANVIMGDFIKPTSDFLAVALLSTLNGPPKSPESPDGPAKSPQDNGDHPHHLDYKFTHVVVIIGAFAIADLGICFLCCRHVCCQPRVAECPPRRSILQSAPRRSTRLIHRQQFETSETTARLSLADAISVTSRPSVEMSAVEMPRVKRPSVHYTVSSGASPRCL